MKLELDLNKLESISYKLTDTISLLIFNQDNKLIIETRELETDVFNNTKASYFDFLSRNTPLKQNEKYSAKEEYKNKINNIIAEKKQNRKATKDAFQDIINQAELKAKELNKVKIEKIGEIVTSDTNTVYIKEKNEE